MNDFTADNPQNIRYIQRFQNFSRAWILLRSAFAEKELNEFSLLEKERLIQRFEYTFELAWKTFKDYLEFSGFILTEATPRKVIKECVSAGIFSQADINPDIYLNMLLTRNQLSHIYDFQKFSEAIKTIKEQYLSELENEYNFFNKMETGSNV